MFFVDQSTEGTDCRPTFLLVPRSVNYDSITDDSSSSAQTEQFVKYVCNELAKKEPAVVI